MRVLKFLLIGTLLGSFTTAFAKEPKKVCWTDSFEEAALKLSALAQHYKDQKNGPKLSFRKAVSAEVKFTAPEDSPSGEGSIDLAAVDTPNGLGTILKDLPIEIVGPDDSTTTDNQSQEEPDTEEPLELEIEDLNIPAGASLKLLSVDTSNLAKEGFISLELENHIVVNLEESKDQRGAADILDTLFSAGVRPVGIMENAIACSLDFDKNSKGLGVASVSESQKKETDSEAHKIPNKKIAKAKATSTL